MEIRELTDEQIEEQIETFQDRIETMQDYISDTEDSFTRASMQTQLQRYKMTLLALRQERQMRVTSASIESNLDLKNFLFKSSDHLRYENGKHVSGPHGGASRAIKVEQNISGGQGYTVTIYNLDGSHPVWDHNVQMAPKQMKIIQQSSEKIVLRGYGCDMMGSSFADFGLTIHVKNGSVEKCILHMYDRNIDIEYLKSEGQSLETASSQGTGLAVIESFFYKWQSEFPMDVKIAIARKTDELNNIGAAYYNEDDLINAIHYFNEALEVMPINDDALENLAICYRMTNDFEKMQETQARLKYLKELGV